jgi:hypothetical protein
MNGIIGEYKCPRCAWVHVAVTQEFAEQTSTPGSTGRLHRCFNCAGPSIGFLPASHDDAPIGCTLQPVVLDDVETE